MNEEVDATKPRPLLDSDDVGFDLTGLSISANNESKSDDVDPDDVDD
jgi:hypothetical protein